MLHAPVIIQKVGTALQCVQLCGFVRNSSFSLVGCYTTTITKGGWPCILGIYPKYYALASWLYQKTNTKVIGPGSG